MNSADLKQYVLDNPKLVSMKSAGDGLHILKYKKCVFYDGLWNEFIAECRGTIVDDDFDVVSRPFTKIYNYGIETEAPEFSDDTLVTAFRKVNGFMVSVTWHDGKILVSTTGSTDSPYVEMAKEMMLTHMSWPDWAIVLCNWRDETLLFECVHPNDPHIVPEKPGMYLIGFREKTWDSNVAGYGLMDFYKDIAKDYLNCYAAESYFVTVGELKKMTKECRHEGFVFYDKNNVSSKIKSPYYLTLKWVARNPRTNKLMTEAFRQLIDEEYYGLLDSIRENIVEYTAMDEQQRLTWVRNYFGDEE